MSHADSMPAQLPDELSERERYADMLQGTRPIPSRGLDDQGKIRGVRGDLPRHIEHDSLNPATAFDAIGENNPYRILLHAGQDSINKGWADSQLSLTTQLRL